MKVIMKQDSQESVVTGRGGICRTAIRAEGTYREPGLCLRWPDVGDGSMGLEQMVGESGRKSKG